MSGLNEPRSNVSGVAAARIRIGVACLLSVVACFAYASTRATFGGTWYQANAGGVPYVIFWILFTGCFLPKRRYSLMIALGVVIATCLLEVLQLWNPEPLASFRMTRFGAALLGSSYSWNDIPPYFLGGVIGGSILWALGAESPEKQCN